MKKSLRNLIVSIAIPLLVGGLASFLTKDNMEAFEALNQPVLSPPGWLFPIVWSVLYIMMGIASYLVFTSDAPKNKINFAKNIYFLQLFFNFAWSILFFNIKAYFAAFVWLLILWILIITTIILFSRVSHAAALLLIPYLIWVTFAAYLNLGVAILN